jgi:hypothetical protein
MNWAIAQNGAAVPGDMPGKHMSVLAAITSADAGDWPGSGKIKERAATVPESERYPHVTCGWGSQASDR